MRLQERWVNFLPCHAPTEDSRAHGLLRQLIACVLSILLIRVQDDHQACDELQLYHASGAARCLNNARGNLSDADDLRVRHDAGGDDA